MSSLVLDTCSLFRNLGVNRGNEYMYLFFCFQSSYQHMGLETWFWSGYVAKSPSESLDPLFLLCCTHFSLSLLPYFSYVPRPFLLQWIFTVVPRPHPWFPWGQVCPTSPRPWQRRLKSITLFDFYTLDFLFTCSCIFPLYLCQSPDANHLLIL